MPILEGCVPSCSYNDLHGSNDGTTSDSTHENACATKARMPIPRRLSWLVVCRVMHASQMQAYLQRAEQPSFPLQQRAWNRRSCLDTWRIPRAARHEGKERARQKEEKWHYVITMKRDHEYLHSETADTFSLQDQHTSERVYDGQYAHSVRVCIADMRPLVTDWNLPRVPNPFVSGQELTHTPDSVRCFATTRVCTPV